MAPTAAPLSSISGPSSPTKPSKLSDYTGLSHAPHAAKPSAVVPLTIRVDDGPNGGVPGFLHVAPTSSLPTTTAAILLSGAGGGVVGPSSIYLSLADKLPSMKQPVSVLRLDYRFPARNNYCVRDVLTAMDYLEKKYQINKFVLVGWSFGSAPVFTVGGTDKRVVGCATVAAQTAETDGIRSLAPRPLLLLHGTGDRSLSHACSERLFAQYGTKGDRELKLFNGDDHALTRKSLKAETLIGEFVLKCSGSGLGDGDSTTLRERSVTQDEMMELMKKGGDLRNESVE